VEGELAASGVDIWNGSTERLATLRGALEGVAIACWLMADEPAGEQRVASFIAQIVDSTVRGLVYEAAGCSSEVKRLCALNAIPLAVVSESPAERARWLSAAREAVASLIG